MLRFAESAIVLHILSVDVMWGHKVGDLPSTQALMEGQPFQAECLRIWPGPIVKSAEMSLSNSEIDFRPQNRISGLTKST